MKRLSKELTPFFEEAAETTKREVEAGINLRAFKQRLHQLMRAASQANKGEQPRNEPEKKSI